MPAIGPLFARIAQGLARGGSSGGGGLDGVLLGRNFDLKIEFDDAEWRRWQRRLPNGFRRGIAQGLNQGGKQVRTATDRAIRARRPLPRKVVLAGLDITPATVNRLEWVMTVSGRPPPIEQYGMRVSPGRGRR